MNKDLIFTHAGISAGPRILWTCQSVKARSLQKPQASLESASELPRIGSSCQRRQGRGLDINYF